MFGYYTVIYTFTLATILGQCSALKYITAHNSGPFFQPVWALMACIYILYIYTWWAKKSKPLPIYQ